MVENIICDCGMLVRGTSKKHLESNLKAHKKGNKHKNIIKIKEGGIKTE